MVQLSDDLLEVLDRAANRRGASRSALIRELLWHGLAEDHHVLVGERIAAGYRRVPPGEPDDWGDVGTGIDTSTEEVLSRLDAEEREHGHEPW
jgi:predicted transcriptional regulator